jgi:hypothetical protein
MRGSVGRERSTGSTSSAGNSPRAGHPLSETKGRTSFAGEWSLGEAKVTGGALRWLDESHGKPFNASIEGNRSERAKARQQGCTPAEFDAAWRCRLSPGSRATLLFVKGGRLDLASVKC